MKVVQEAFHNERRGDQNCLRVVNTEGVLLLCRFIAVFLTWAGEGYPEHFRDRLSRERLRERVDKRIRFDREELTAVFNPVRDLLQFHVLDDTNFINRGFRPQQYKRIAVRANNAVNVNSKLVAAKRHGVPEQVADFGVKKSIGEGRCVLGESVEIDPINGSRVARQKVCHVFQASACASHFGINLRWCRVARCHRRRGTITLSSSAAGTGCDFTTRCSCEAVPRAAGFGCVVCGRSCRVSFSRAFVTATAKDEDGDDNQ